MDKLIENAWYWVRIKKSDGWFPARYNTNCAGGWTNDDTWEDFGNRVVDFVLIPSVHKIILQKKEIK